MPIKMREHKPSALVVDPDLDMATLATAILNDSGFLATILTDIGDFYDVVERLEPDVVLIDIKGYADQAARDAVEWLQSRPNPIPIVMFTTSPQMADTVGITPAGQKFVDFVSKPFDLQDLIATLQRAVAGRAPMPAVVHVKPMPSISSLLRDRGIKDIQEAPDREWVVFRDTQGALVQIYWWENANAYCISRARPGVKVLEDLGRTKTAEEAVQRALA